jgi:hypothetical protein
VLVGLLIIVGSGMFLAPTSPNPDPFHGSLYLPTGLKGLPVMAQITPPPDRNSQGTWPHGEPQSVRTAEDNKNNNK